VTRKIKALKLLPSEEQLNSLRLFFYWRRYKWWEENTTETFKSEVAKGELIGNSVSFSFIVVRTF